MDINPIVSNFINNMQEALNNMAKEIEEAVKADRDAHEVFLPKRESPVDALLRRWYNRGFDNWTKIESIPFGEIRARGTDEHFEIVAFCTKDDIPFADTNTVYVIATFERSGCEFELKSCGTRLMEYFDTLLKIGGDLKYEHVTSAMNTIKSVNDSINSWSRFVNWSWKTKGDKKR